MFDFTHGKQCLILCTGNNVWFYARGTMLQQYLVFGTRNEICLYAWATMFGFTHGEQCLVLRKVNNVWFYVRATMVGFPHTQQLMFGFRHEQQCLVFRTGNSIWF